MTLALQLKNYYLTTAKIYYRMPDHTDLLQLYVWQDLDIAPNYPVLRKFLDFWGRELDGPLHSVEIAHMQLIGPAEIRNASMFRIH